jgi:hypothetical protein
MSRAGPGVAPRLCVHGAPADCSASRWAPISTAMNLLTGMGVTLSLLVGHGHADRAQVQSAHAARRAQHTHAAPSGRARSSKRASSLPGAGAGGQNPLTWAPPTMTDPTVITVRSGEDPDVLNLSTSQDYILKLPSSGIRGTLEVNGGHNVVLIGGEITVPSSANQTDNGADDTDTAIYIRASTGTVHVEGVLIRAAADTKFDGIDINAPEAVVHVENVRVEDVYGSLTTEHADVIQTWGGAKALDVDDLTANGDYQGLTIDPDLGSLGSADIENVDLTAEAPPTPLAQGTVGGGIMLWLTAGTNSCESSPVTLNDVYISDTNSLIAPASTVWPSPSSGLKCDARVKGSTVSWPGLPVNGSLTLSAPPDGSFVPEGVAGNSYVSPGYATP